MSKQRPKREWRLLHRAKVAKKNGDSELLSKLAHEFAKLKERETL